MSSGNQDCPNPFLDIINDVEITYSDNLEDKGDSWKTMPLDLLDNKLKEELREYEEAKGMKDTYCELIDVILVSLMLAKRLKSSYNKSKNKEDSAK